MTTTYQVDAGTMNPTTTEAPKENTMTETTHDRDFYISDVLNNLPHKAKRDVAWALISSTNVTIINALLRHHRVDPFADIPEAGGIDAYNDALAACDEQLKNNEHASEIGHTPEVDPWTVAASFATIRGYFAERLTQVESEDKMLLSFKRDNNGAQPIAETMKFLLRSQPNLDPKVLEQEALAHDIPVEALRQAKILAKQQSKAELAKFTPAILDSAANFGDSASANDADDTFNALPIETRYNFIAKILLTMGKRASKSLSWFSQSNNLEELNNYKLISGCRDELILEAHKWIDEHMQELEAAFDAGKRLAEMPALPAKYAVAA